MNPISNNNGGFARFISRMTKTDALAPIIALEATVVGGRTLHAYKRGGEDEARERFFEEIMGSIVWLFAVKAFNSIGDKILGKILKSGNTKFDVGTDKILRTPFENFVKDGMGKKFSKGQIAAMKGVKVLTSVLLGNLIIGLIVPKINHALTNKIRHNRLLEQQKQQVNVQNKDENIDSSATSFKGADFSAMNWFTNAIENTNTGKLLSTDVGCAGGRMLNARTKEERREIGIRDIGSIYFYMWAQGHVRNLLNFVETGYANRLSPTDAKRLQERLNAFIEKNGDMDVEEFRKAFLGKKSSEISLPDGIKFESGKLSLFDKIHNNFSSVKREPLQVVKVSELENIIKDKELMNRIREMSKLQPERMGDAVITKTQIIDAINKAEINDPQFLYRAFSDFTCAEYDKTGKLISEGASADKYKYISNKTLYNYKKHMEEYVEQICKKAQKTDSKKITKDIIKKFEKNNFAASGINFAAGFTVAALFLSTFIPKIQYWVTKTKTGVDAFPGIYDYEHHKEVDA